MSSFRAEAAQISPLDRVQQILHELVASGGPLRVLEAGCGSLPMALDVGRNAHLVGIDVSEEQLQRNDVVAQKILGDVQVHSFEPESFDVVFCWDVLEHLPHPDLALDNFRRATRPGGVIVLKLPNVASAKGMVTKFTPHVFHVWVYRRILRYPNAGRPGFTPFPTYLRWSIAPHRLLGYAARHGMPVEYAATYEADRQAALRARLRLQGAPWRRLAALARRASRGRFELEGTEVVVVFRNPGGGA